MYTPHLWENGEVITASKLNAIELGIDQKVDTPSEAGTPGQVLTLNGDLQPYWGDGGGSGTGATNLASAFSISVNYYPPDLVLYNNKLYRCIQSHYGSWNAAHFTEVTVADELNGVNWDEDNLTQFYHSHGLQKMAPIFDRTDTYQIGDYVLYAGYLYKNLTGTAGTDPSVDRTNWEYCPPVLEGGDATARQGIAAIESSLDAAPTEATINSILDEIEAGNEWLTSIKNGIEPLADGVPSYFRDNLKNALTAYKTNAEEVGVNGDSCIFITDTHWGSNQKHSPDLIRWLVKHSNLRNVFCGGDILDTSSIANEMRKGYDFIERFTDIPGGLKTVIGNHDYNKNNHTEQPEYWLSKAQVYSLFYPKAEMEINDFQCLEPGEGYYEFSFYVDVPATNTRYLFVSIPFGSVYTVTKDWVVAQLTDNPTKNFVIISHYLYNVSTGTYPGGANALIYDVKSFSNLKAWLFGHSHVDLVLYTSTGIPLVCTDTDSSRLASSNPYSYTIGTITEQAFDIVTINHTNQNVECARVGRGKNRRVNGGLNEVTVNNTITLTPTIIPTSWESSDTSIATVNNGAITGVAAGQATIKAVSNSKDEYWCVKVSAT